MYKHVVKRMFDVVISGVACVVLVLPMLFRQRRVGKFICKYILDELPQIYQVFTGEFSCIAPRPTLWLQDDLVAEREKYGGNGAQRCRLENIGL